MLKADNKDIKTKPNWLYFGVFICSSISFLNFEHVSAGWVICLRLTNNDKRSSYEGFLRKDGSVSGHHENINYLLLSYWDVWSQKHFNHRDSKRYFYGIKWKPLLSSKPKWFQTTTKNYLSRQWEHLIYRSKNLG